MFTADITSDKLGFIKNGVTVIFNYTHYPYLDSTSLYKRDPQGHVVYNADFVDLSDFYDDNEYVRPGGYRCTKTGIYIVTLQITRWEPGDGMAVSLNLI